MRWCIALALVAAALAPPAPRPVLTLLNGEALPLDALRGKVVVLDFWATWCVPCRAELADLDAYAAINRDRVVAIAVLAEPHPDLARVAAATATLHLPIALRLTGGAARFPLRFGAVPTTYVLDRSGRTAFVQAGPFRPGELRARVDPLLAAAPP